MPFKKRKNLLELTLTNKIGRELFIWTEFAAIGIDIPDNYEYKIITDDKKLNFEFTKEGITIYFETRWGFELYKKAIDGEEWELDIDLSDIQMPEGTKRLPKDFWPKPFNNTEE
ncbi:MAG: hypothetical protein NT150_00620 [Bacteroidetes bacterium]|nr:hypothetical protein [Bacteroidota bacterium]